MLKQNTTAYVYLFSKLKLITKKTSRRLQKNRRQKMSSSEPTLPSQ